MSRSLTFMALVNVRVAGQLSWVPAHIKNGKAISSRVEIPVYANTGKGIDPKTGEKGRKDPYKLIIWGPLADTCCKSLPTGKELSVFGRPDPYLGKLYSKDGVVRLDSAGTEITIQKQALVVTELDFGDDSAKHIAQEVQTGRRPMHWNVPNHPDWALWVKILNDRQALLWDGRSPTFENARVILPQGPGIMIDFETLNKGRKVPVQQGFSGQNLPNQVAAAFGGFPGGQPATQPLFDPMTGQRLAPVQPVALFDPMTGQPLNQMPAQPKAMFNPMTGQPIGQATAASGFVPSIPAAGTALF